MLLPCNDCGVGGVLLELAVGRDTIEVLRGIDPSNAGEKLGKAFMMTSERVKNTECQVRRRRRRRRRVTGNDPKEASSLSDWWC